MVSQNNYPSLNNKFKASSDVTFFLTFISLSCIYIFLLIGITLADFKYVDLESIDRFFSDPNIIYSLKLSVFSCTITTLLCLLVAVPLGYLMSRFDFRGKDVLDTVLDIPIMLPPIVVGISLLIFFNMEIIRDFETFIQASWLQFVQKYDILLRNNWDKFKPKINPTFTVASVILAQFMVSCAFAIRSMRTTFDEISIRQEKVALTLGCSRGQAFWRVVLPRAKRGMVTAATLSWARSLGEFGPILIFAGSTRMKTEVLSTTVYLEFSVGNLAMATTVSVFMIITASLIILLMRTFGKNQNEKRGEKP
jgi:molybdate transport system permease protein